MLSRHALILVAFILITGVLGLTTISLDVIQPELCLQPDYPSCLLEFIIHHVEDTPLVPDHDDVYNNTTTQDDIVEPGAHHNSSLVYSTLINLGGWADGIKSAKAVPPLMLYSGQIASNCTFIQQQSSLLLHFQPQDSRIRCVLEKDYHPTILLDFHAIGVTGNTTQLPPLAYYKQPFAIIPNVDCFDQTKLHCQVKVQFPVAAGPFFIRTTTKFETTSCSSSFVWLNPVNIHTPQETTMNIPYDLNTTYPLTLYEVRYSANVPLPQPTSTISGECTFKVNKHAVTLLNPIIEIMNHQKNIVLYTQQLTAVNNVQVGYNPDDCTDSQSPLCTVHVDVPVIQEEGRFTIDIPYFTTAYNKPQLVSSYTNREGFTLYRYTQQWVKPIQPSQTTTPIPREPAIIVNVKGWFGQSIHHQLLLGYESLTYFPYEFPITVDVDKDLCLNGVIPFCRVIYRAKGYIGYAFVAKMQNIPFFGEVDTWNCTNGMHFDIESATRLTVTSAFRQDSQGLWGSEELLVDTDEHPIQCIIDYTLAYQGNTQSPRIELIEFHHLVQYPTNIIPIQTKNGPKIKTKQIEHLIFYTTNIITQLDGMMFKFDTLPFSISTHNTCAGVYEPNCTMYFNLSPNSTLLGFNDPTMTDDEKNNILGHAFLRKFSISLYDLKEANFDYGETWFVWAEVIGSGALSISWEALPYSLINNPIQNTPRYDIITISPVLLEPELYTINNYFWDNKNGLQNGVLSNITIALTYIMSPTNKGKDHVPVQHDIYLIQYAGLNVRNEQPISIYTTTLGEIYYIPFFRASPYQSTCESPNSMYCVIRHESLLDPTISPAVAAQIDGLILKSIIVEISTKHIIDLDWFATDGSTILSITPLTQRIIPATEITTERVNSISQWKIELGPITPTSIIDLYFIKRLGADSLSKISIVHYEAIKMIGDNAYPVAKPMDYFYNIIPIVYHGDGRLTMGDNCRSLSNMNCTLSFSFTTNHLKPGLTLLSTTMKNVESHFFYYEYHGCTGIIGMEDDLTRSKDYIYLDYDALPNTNYSNSNNTSNNNNHSAIVFKTNSTSFTELTPLGYNHTTHRNITCIITALKTTKQKIYHPPTIPDIMLGIDYRVEPYHIYALPNQRKYATTWDQIQYKMLVSIPQDDCYTSFQGFSTCTTHIHLSPSQEHPIKYATQRLAFKDFFANPIFKLSWLIAQQYWGDAICRGGQQADVQAIVDYVNNRDNNNNNNDSTNPFIITSTSPTTTTTFATQYQKAQDMQFSKDYFNTQHVTTEDVNKLTNVITTMNNIVNKNKPQKQTKQKHQQQEQQHVNQIFNTLDTTTFIQKTPEEQMAELIFIIESACGIFRVPPFIEPSDIGNITSYGITQPTYADPLCLFGIWRTNDLTIRVDTPFQEFKNPLNTWAIYTTEFHLCDLPQYVYFKLKILEQYQTTPSLGFFKTLMLDHLLSNQGLATMGLTTYNATHLGQFHPIIQSFSTQWAINYDPRHDGDNNYLSLQIHSTQRTPSSPIVLGQIIQLTNSLQYVSNGPQNTIVKFSFLQPNIKRIIIHSLLINPKLYSNHGNNTQTQDEYLHCYQNEAYRILKVPFGKLTFDEAKSITYFNIIDIHYPIGISCELKLYVSRWYPTLTQAVKHQVELITPDDITFNAGLLYNTYLTYPIYQNHAYVNTTQNYRLTIPTRVRDNDSLINRKSTITPPPPTTTTTVISNTNYIHRQQKKQSSILSIIDTPQLANSSNSIIKPSTLQLYGLIVCFTIIFGLLSF